MKPKAEFMAVLRFSFSELPAIGNRRRDAYGGSRTLQSGKGHAVSSGILPSMSEQPACVENKCCRCNIEA